MTYAEFADLVILGNRAAHWIQAVCVGALAFATLLSVRGYLLRSFRNYAETPTVIDDVGIAIVRRVRPAYLFLIAMFTAGSIILTFAAAERHIFQMAVMIVTLLQIGFCIQAVIDVFIKTAPDELGKGHRYMASGVLALSRIIVWFTILMLALDTVGFDVMAAVTTFGIGGIAVALAVQGFLKDMFASFAILLDQPFQVGDYITFDDKGGTVERIGVKTTRLRTNSGEELILNNADLLESRVHNHRRAAKRRVTLELVIGYESGTAILRDLPKRLQATINKRDLATYESATFSDYTPQGLDLEIVYSIEEADYRVFTEVRHAINLDVHEVLTSLGVPFGYNTHRTFVHDASASAPHRTAG